jgi:hypothetical protein
VVTVAPRRPRIEFRADDPTLTPNGGLALVAQTCRVLDVIGTIERHVGPIKARLRGAGAGELLVGLAECMLAGGDFFTDLDPTDVEVHGEGKERIGWSYAGVRAGRPVPLVWAESGLVLTGTLLAGALRGTPSKLLHSFVNLRRSVPITPRADKPAGPQQASMRTHRLTDAHGVAIMQAYQGGRSMASLATDYRVTRETVSKLLRRSGVAIRQARRMSQSEIDQAAQLYERGL